MILFYWDLQGERHNGGVNWTLIKLIDGLWFSIVDVYEAHRPINKLEADEYDGNSFPREYHQQHQFGIPVARPLVERLPRLYLNLHKLTDFKK